MIDVTTCNPCGGTVPFLGSGTPCPCRCHTGGASRSGRVSDVPAEPVRQSDTACGVSDGAPIVRGASDANGTFVAESDHGQI